MDNISGKKIVSCHICGKHLTNASLKRHLDTQHSVKQKRYLERMEQDKGSYQLDFLKGKFNPCLVENCTGGAKEKFGMYRHFCLVHPQADILIMEDGKLPKCTKCGMRVVDMDKHLDSYTCKKGASRRANEIKQDRQARAEEVKFFIDGIEIEWVREFKYLGVGGR